MEQSYHVTLSLDDCRDLIYDTVTDSVTGALIGAHTVEGRDGRRCQVDVYEKHYYRAGNRLTLTVILDDFGAGTRVRCIGGGAGGQGGVGAGRPGLGEGSRIPRRPAGLRGPI